MAQHNPGSRTFLLVVLAGIVVGFVIALFLFSGGDSDEKAGSSEQPSTEPAAEEPAVQEPAAAPPAAPAPVERPVDDMSDDMTPPDEMPIDDVGDGVTPPPDELIDEPVPDGAPDASVSAPEPAAPDAAAPDAPPAAPNP